MNHYFTGPDGTFDILKYADPDLDLLGPDNKTIFDDLVEVSKQADDTKKTEGKEEEKSEAKSEIEGNIHFITNIMSF